MFNIFNKNKSKKEKEQENQKAKTRRADISYLDLLQEVTPKAYAQLVAIGDTSPDIYAVFPQGQIDTDKVTLAQKTIEVFAKIILWCFKKDWKAIKKRAVFLSKNEVIEQKTKAQLQAEKSLRDLHHAVTMQKNRDMLEKSIRKKELTKGQSKALLENNAEKPLEALPKGDSS